MLNPCSSLPFAGVDHRRILEREIRHGADIQPVIARVGNAQLGQRHVPGAGQADADAGGVLIVPPEPFMAPVPSPVTVGPPRCRCC